MEVKYELPLELRCIMPTTQMTPQGGLINVIKSYRAAIMWKDILAIEEAIFNHQMPNVEEDCCHILTQKCVYIVKGNFETLASNWIEYKEWLNKSKPNFNFNAN